MTEDEKKIEQALNYEFFKEVAARRIRSTAWNWNPEYNFRATYISLDRMEMVGLSEENIKISVKIGKRFEDWEFWSVPVAEREAPKLEAKAKTRVENLVCSKCDGSGVMEIEVMVEPETAPKSSNSAIEEQLKVIREMEFKLKSQLGNLR